MEGRIIDPETRLRSCRATHRARCSSVASRASSYYYRDPALTAARIDADGWYSTGDQLVQDEAGRFRFIGRLGDMLKVGGENVAPADVENYLATHPAVHMVQVVGAPDARYAEVCAAFVELVPGAARSPRRELIDFCLGRIATYKVPRYVVFVTEWPMSGTKIQKFKLREQITEQLKPTPASPRRRSSTASGSPRRRGDRLRERAAPTSQGQLLRRAAAGRRQDHFPGRAGHLSPSCTHGLTEFAALLLRPRAAQGRQGRPLPQPLGRTSWSRSTERSGWGAASFRSVTGSARPNCATSSATPRSPPWSRRPAATGTTSSPTF